MVAVYAGLGWPNKLSVPDGLIFKIDPEVVGVPKLEGVAAVEPNKDEPVVPV